MVMHCFAKALREGLITQDQYSNVVEQVLANPDTSLTHEDLVADEKQQKLEEEAEESRNYSADEVAKK